MGDGRIAGANAAADAVLPSLISLAHGRLALRSPSDQAKLEEALRVALLHTPAPTLMRINGSAEYARPLLMVLPITGNLRDIFSHIMAFVPLIDGARKIAIAPGALDLLRASFQLTPREAAVASAIASGQSFRIDGACRRLRLRACFRRALQSGCVARSGGCGAFFMERARSLYRRPNPRRRRCGGRALCCRFGKH